MYVFIAATWNVVVSIWPMAFLAVGYFFGRKALYDHIRERLNDEQSRHQYAAELREDRFLHALQGRRYGEEDYRRRLSGLLDRLDTHLGKRLFLSPRGFIICVSVALIYGNLFVLLSWLFGFRASGEVLDILPIGWEWWKRAVLVILLAVEGILSYHLCLRALQHPSKLWKIGYWFAMCVCAYLSIALAHTLTTGIFRFFRPGMDHYSFAVLLLAYGAAYSGCMMAALRHQARWWVLVGLFVLLTAISGASAFADGVSGPHDQFTVLLILVLPMTNAVFDWPSWGISRWLMRALAARQATLRRLSIHILIDLCAALVLAIGIAAAMPVVVGLARVGIPVLDVLDNLRNDPWGDGLWITLMVLSTFFPTLLHILAILASALLCRFPESVRRANADKLQPHSAIISVAAVRTEPSAPSMRDLDDVARFLTFRCFFAFAVAILIGAFVLISVQTGLRPVGALLCDLAHTSARLTETEDSSRIRAKFLVVRAEDLLLELDRPEDALETAAYARTLAPSLPTANEAVAVILNHLGRHDEALAVCDQALLLIPDAPEVHLARGQTLHNLGRLKEALRNKRKALSLDPNRAGAHYSLSVTLHELGEYDEALTEVTQAISLEPGIGSYYHGYGITLDALARYQEADDAYATAIRLAPRRAEYYHSLAVHLTDTQRAKEALAPLRRALRLEPDNARFHSTLGVALHDLERYEEALAEKTRAMAIEPENARYHRERSATLHVMGRAEEALAESDRAVELDPDNALSYYGRGVILQDLERYDEALAAKNRAITLDPQDAASHHSRSITLQSMGRYVEAVSASDTAIELSPDNALYHDCRGSALHDLEQYDEALAAKSRAVAIDSEDAGLYHSRCITLYEMNRLEEALVDSDTALELDPDTAQYHYARGVILQDLERYEEALAAKTRATAIEPQNAKYHSTRGATLFRLARYEEALQEADTAAQLAPEYAMYHYNLGETLQALERYDEALEALREAIRLDATDPDFYYRAGLVLDRMGRYAEALAEVDASLELDPDNTASIVLREQILAHLDNG
ncbi:MAG: tetratricopeptide repeat protein [Planctomycetes bacterium]|nr:tetratricopeptide repeat protein [Planctomycetota bacterium]NOG55167.1 tetratricopeptide repeat protein [Planctomycetota bacterium]